MNKNTKKFVVTLLSVLMVLSFMPTMAFAATGDVTQDVTVTPYNHSYSTTPDAKLSKAATCSEFGMNVFTCNVNTKIEDSEGTKVPLKCNAQKRNLTQGTHKTIKDRITVAQALQILIDKGEIETLDDLNAFLTATAGKCYAFVDKCTVCDDYDIDLATIGSEDWQGHVAPAKPACAESFTCETCGLPVTRTIARTAHNWEHNYSNSNPNIGQVRWWGWEYIGINCANGTDNGVALYKNVCRDCGKEVVLPFVLGTPVHTGKLDDPKYTAAQWAALDSATKTKVQPYLIQYNGDWYEPNDFDDDVKGPDCTHDSDAGYGLLVCPDCGLQLPSTGTCKVAKTGHIPTKVTTPASCTTDGWDITYCGVCGTLISEKKNSDKATGHSYKVTKVAEPTIYDDGITLIECEKCGMFTTNRLSDVHDERAWAADRGYNDPRTVRNSKSDNSGDWYFIGFSGEFYDTTDASKPRITENAIKLDPWQQLTPHFTAYATMAEASCTLPEIQAMKDTVSGDFYVHAPKTIGKPLGHDKETFEVKATCGDYGYKYDTCKRCKCILKGGKTTEYTTEDLALWGAISLGVAYDLQDPIVLLGTPCQFAWGDLDENTEAMICTKCGAVKEGTQTPKTEEKKAREAAEAAKPVIEEAANITNDTATYKASSIEAIKAAKANLDTAIYAGSAEQIKKATAELQAAIAAAEKKVANTMKAKGKTVKANSKKKTTFSKAKAFKISGAKGTVTFKKKSGNKKVTVSKAGKVTVKKGLKKGKTYKIKVTVKAAGNGDYLAKSQVVTLKVKVK